MFRGPSLIVVCLLVASGCETKTEIQSYRVSKPDAAASKYEVPEGWVLGKVGGMRKAAFTVAEGEKKVEITVIDLPPMAGDVLANVNRWRGQVGLEPVTPKELKEQLTTIKVDSLDGSYVELIGPPKDDRRPAILGVIVPTRGRVWFLKLTGDAELAAREKKRFEEFVKSVHFAGLGGGDHGP